MESQLLHGGYGYRYPCRSHKVDFETAKSYIYSQSIFAILNIEYRIPLMAGSKVKNLE